MKKIEVIIRPHKLEELKDALLKEHVSGLTITPVMGCGNQRGWKEHFRGNEIIMNLLQKTKVELVVADANVQALVDIIIKVCRTGEVGDGKIFVTDIARCIRIRTGDEGEAAL